MRNRLLTVTLFAILTTTFTALASTPARAQTTKEVAAAAAQKSEKTLYQRLGGYDAIAAVSDDFVQRLVANKQISRFLVGLSVDSQKRLRQHFVDFICEKSGGPCFYLGRDMKTAHTGLHITEDDWKSAAADLVATLDKFKVPQKEKDEVVGLVVSLHDDIVNR